MRGSAEVHGFSLLPCAAHRQHTFVGCFSGFRIEESSYLEKGNQTI